MHRFFTHVMQFFGILTGILLIFLIITQISWSIYIRIYSSYLWGLLFPHARFKTIVFVVTLFLCLFTLGIIWLIRKIR